MEINIPNDSGQDMDSHKSKNSPWSVLVVIVLLVIVGSAWFYFFNLPKNSQLGNSDEIFIPIKDSFLIGDTDTAIELSKSLLQERGGEDVQSMIYLTRGYLEKGSATFNEKEYSDLALGVIKKLEEIAPANPEVYRLKGYAYEIVEEYDNAISSYKQAIATYPEFSLAYSHMGHAYDLMGIQDLAIEAYQKALSINPDQIEALLYMSRIYYSLGELDLAEESIMSVLEQDNLEAKTLSRAYTQLGVILLDKESYPEAEEFFTKAIMYDEEYSTAWNGLAGTLILKADRLMDVSEIDQNYVDRIYDSVVKAMSLHRFNTQSYINMGHLEFYFYGQCENALSMYTKAKDEILDQDITLGSLEKSETREEINTILDYVSSQCNIE